MFLTGIRPHPFDDILEWLSHSTAHQARSVYYPVHYRESMLLLELSTLLPVLSWISFLRGRSLLCQAKSLSLTGVHPAGYKVPSYIANNL